MSFKPGRAMTYVRAFCWLGSWLGSFGRSSMMSFDSRESGDRSVGILTAYIGGKGWPLIHTIILKAVGG
jgi:hypothetical protein